MIVPGPALLPIFVNARAGTADRDFDELRRTIQSAWRERHGAEIEVEIRDVAPERLQHDVARERDAGTPVIGIGGGDGTLNNAATALAGSEAALLCIPLGTLNNFARRLGIESVEDAAHALAGGDVQAMAVGTVGSDGRIFLNTLTFGEYPRIVRLRDRIKHRIGKWPAALVAFAVTLTTLRRITVTLDAEEQRITRRTPFVWVGIGWGSFPRVHESLERRTSPDLEVAVARASNRRGAAAFVGRVALRMIRDHAPVRDRDLEVLHTRTLTLVASHRLDATADGEVIRLPARVDIGVRDGALRVLQHTPAAP